MKRGLLIGVGTLGGLGAVFAITPPQFGTSGPVGLAALSGKATTPAAAAGITGTFDGNTASTRWGPVQVRLVVKDGKIVDASALQSPSGDSRSRSISQQAIPYLVQETLAAQSDQISGVGGASYTSNGWYTSLQSALKKAGL